MHRRPLRSRRTHRHRRWSRGKCSRWSHRPPSRRRHQAKSSANRSAGHHRLRRRHRSGRPCWASGYRRSASRQEDSRSRRRPDRSDRHSGRRHSGRRHFVRRHRGRRSDHRTGRRHLARRRHPERHLANHRRLARPHPGSRRSFRLRHSACSSRSGHLANRCYPMKTRKIASRRRGSASKHRHRRCYRPKACSASYARHLSCRRKNRCCPKSRRSMATTVKTAWTRTIAVAGSRPSGIRRLHRSQSPARRRRAETCASAEYASFLLVPPPHRRGPAPS